MKKKPAMLVVTELYPNVTNSFLGSFVVQQLRHLSRHYSIVVLTTHFISYRNRFRLKQEAYRNDGGIQVYSIPYFPPWLNAIRAMKLISQGRYLEINKRLTRSKLGRLAKRLHRRHQFKLVYGQETYIGDEAVPIGSRLGIPSVFTLHGLFSHHRRLFGPSVLASAMRNMENADRLISVSRVAADSYRGNGFRRSDITVIANGTSPLPSPIPAPFLRNFTQDKIVLLTVGFFVPEKRISQSVHALRYVHDAGERSTVLVLVGKGDQERELRDLVDRLGLAEAVLFAGEVNPADMPSVYAASDILVHPSVVESFSMVCLEAMSYGKPIVCTNGIGILEFIRPGVDSVVVPPDNQTLLSVAVTELVKHPEDRCRMGEAARLTARSLGWENQAEKIRRILESV